MATKRTCFVISPIGAAGSDTRKRADNLFKFVITPAIEPLGFEPLRSDQISESGNITSQMIQHLLDDPLVIADLTSSNPNVYYELAIRHATRKPFIQVVDRSEMDRLPFDIVNMRTVPYDLQDLECVEEARAEIGRQAQAYEDGASVDTPVSMASKVQDLNKSSDPVDSSIANLVDGIDEIRSMLVRLTGDQERRIPSEADELEIDHRQLLDVIDLTAKIGELPPAVIARWLREVSSKTLGAHLVVAHDYAQAARVARPGSKAK